MQEKDMSDEEEKEEEEEDRCDSAGSSFIQLSADRNITAPSSPTISGPQPVRGDNRRKEREGERPAGENHHKNAGFKVH